MLERWEPIPSKGGLRAHRGSRRGHGETAAQTALEGVGSDNNARLRPCLARPRALGGRQGLATALASSSPPRQIPWRASTRSDRYGGKNRERLSQSATLPKHPNRAGQGST